MDMAGQRGDYKAEKDRDSACSLSNRQLGNQSEYAFSMKIPGDKIAHLV